MTFIYVTHDQTEAMTLGDCIVVMKDGEIQKTGTPKEVFLHPKNMFVAGFIDTPQMNFLDADLLCRKDGYAIEICGNEILLLRFRQQKLKEKCFAKQEVVAGIRPEDVFIIDSKKLGDFRAQVLMTK